MKLDSYSLCGPIKGICKQRAIWATSGNTTQPLIYLQRPKWITDDAVWSKIVDGLRLELPSGFEI